MGTRADFYIGKGESAEWLGSIAWDGYPDGVLPEFTDVVRLEDWRHAVNDFLTREDATLPTQGWPWPWDDSATTDYAYTFEDGRMWVTEFGSDWIRCDHLHLYAYDEVKNPDPQWPHTIQETPLYPDMSARKNVTMGRRSGLIVIGPNGPIEGED